MTKEEAIKFWKFRYEYARVFSDPHWEAQERREHREYVEALRMAIEALSNPTIETFKDAFHYDIAYLKGHHDAMQEMNNDSVNHPAHYTDGNIEVIDYIEDKKFSYHLGNAVKYISRAGKKNPGKTVEDLRKAIWYIERYIGLIEKEGTR